MTKFSKHFFELKKPNAGHKNHFDLSRSKQAVNKENISSYLDVVDNYSHSLGLQLDAACFSEFKPSDTLNVSDKRRKRPLLPYNLTITKEPAQLGKYEHNKTALEFLALKDKTMMTDVNYVLFETALSKRGQDTPTLHEIKQARFELNSQFNLIHNQFGYYVNPADKIEKAVSFFLSDQSNGPRSPHPIREVCLKCAADGACITNSNVLMLNITFIKNKKIHFLNLNDLDDKC